jgi:hypothetical protein
MDPSHRAVFLLTKGHYRHDDVIKAGVKGSSKVLILTDDLYGLWFKEGHGVWLDAPGGLFFNSRQKSMSG